MVALLSVFAEFEREILRERVPAGLAHARQNGKCLGRPATAELHADKVRKLRRSGLSKSESARRLNIGRTSVRRILATPPEKKSSGLFNYAALPMHYERAPVHQKKLGCRRRRRGLCPRTPRI
jgi:DNA invertase Pin-like site-specific DNA recombinase